MGKKSVYRSIADTGSLAWHGGDETTLRTTDGSSTGTPLRSRGIAVEVALDLVEGRLQWGRELAAADGIEFKSVEPTREVASMGPRIRGLGAAAFKIPSAPMSLVRSREPSMLK